MLAGENGGFCGGGWWDGIGPPFQGLDGLWAGVPGRCPGLLLERPFGAGEGAVMRPGARLFGRAFGGRDAGAGRTRQEGGCTASERGADGGSAPSLPVVRCRRLPGKEKS